MPNDGRMAQPVDLAALARDSGRYSAEAFEFIGQGLRHAVTTLKRDQDPLERRHLNASELVDGVLDLAVERFGLLAGPVLRQMHISGPEDIGRITFILIEHEVFTRQPNDSFEDFLLIPAFSELLPPRFQHHLARISL